MLRVSFIVASILMTAASSVSAASASRGAGPRHLWTIRLPVERPEISAIDPVTVYRARRQIAFGSGDEIVVLDDHPGSTSPHEARAFVLDAATGRTIRERTWTTRGWPYIFPTAKDGYVAVTDKGMVSYSPGLKQVVATSPEVARDASPDGSVVAAWSATLRPGHGLTLFLDSSTLEPTGVEVLDTAVASVSSNHTASTAVRPETTNRTILYRPEDEQHPPFDTVCPGAWPFFISEDRVAVFGCGAVEIVSTHGDRLFEAKLEGEETGFAAVARDGSRFATYGNRLHGHWSKLREETFTVFDVERKEAISSIVTRELRGTEMQHSGAALSPDGTLLVVRSAEVVKLYSLP